MTLFYKIFQKFIGGVFINKLERLNDMMIYLNDKNSFNLKTIMEKYNISKSTALRDIRSLEELGMPIFSETGRNGHYGILQNRLLSPIVFNLDEVLALYFSMLTLNSYESTPFHLSLDKLKQKFENCLSEEKIEMLRKSEQIFSLGSISQNNHCEFLKDILNFAINETVCKIKYSKKDIIKSYIVQFFNISSAYGQWYATGYNFETCRTQIFRCDKILDIVINNSYKSKPFSDFLKSIEVLYKSTDAIDFEVTISKEAIDIFYKENYPSMKLYLENEKYIIRGFYNKGEEDFISNYFLRYGKTILSINPVELTILINKKIESLKSYFLSL